MPAPELYDVVELSTAVDGCPPGKTGTVVEVGPGWFLVEISDEHGGSRGTVQVPESAVVRLSSSGRREAVA
jgi:hypothetical protein